MSKHLNYEYILTFNKYSIKCVEFFIDLSARIDEHSAYEILINIPIIQRSKTQEEIERMRIEIINYNYTWCTILLNNNISIQIIKYLLKFMVDYYYIDIIHINQIVKDSNNAYYLMSELMPKTREYIKTYYELRTYNISHMEAYKIATINYGLKNLYELISYEYTDIDILLRGVHFSREQMNFLKLSRYCYSTIEEFNKYKYNIVNNAIKKTFIVSDDFPLTPHGEFIINQ